jgi:hypothetical protein
MRRYLTTLAIALSCAMTGAALHAQSSEPKTKVKTEHAKKVTYTGCVQNGTETRSYLLQDVVPVTKTETSGTSGRVTSTTTYMLVPEGKVELREHVGQKVEVTGVLIKPGKGEAKYKTRTKSNGTEEETRGEVERGPVPQLKVVSVRPLGERCSS